MMYTMKRPYLHVESARGERERERERSSALSAGHVLMGGGAQPQAHHAGQRIAAQDGATAAAAAAPALAVAAAAAAVPAAELHGEAMGAFIRV